MSITSYLQDQVHQRSFPPEQITALASTSDGAYCAAGGVSGAVHIWEVTSGRLLRSWPCHYKKVTCLAFTDSGGELITGGEDTLVTAWLLAEVLDIAAPLPQLGGSSLSPLHSWSDHTLPVTSVAVGSGGGNALVVSTSLDRTVKIRSLGSGVVLRSVTLPSPLTALALDPGEHSIYVGSSTGTIYDVSLVGDVAFTGHTARDTRGSGAPGSGIGGNSSLALASTSTAAAAGGNIDSEHREYVPMLGHSQSVTCLALTGTGSLLLSGSEDASVMVWDLRSRQPIRTFASPVKGPVSGVIVLQKPEYMPAGGTAGGGRSGKGGSGGVGGSGGGGSSGRKGPQRLQPLSQLSKYPGQMGTLKPWEGGFVVLDGSGTQVLGSGGGDGGVGGGQSYYSEKFAAGTLPTTANGGGANNDTMMTDAIENDGGKEESEVVAALRAENLKLREQAEKAMAMAKQYGELNAELQREMLQR
jgi:pre-rRNA-processing protein IPI3